MLDEIPDPIDRKLEHNPTSEEVHQVFRLLIRDNRAYTTTKDVNDENGLYELEITTSGESVGETTEYEYRRFNSPQVPEIHVVYYENGMPVSGTSAARYINGEWKIL